MDTPVEEGPSAGPHRPTVGTALWLLALAWSAGIASFRLTDNSFLTHLATGRLILDDLSVPTTDPYTYTARGTDWTVQSWLMSVIYAGAERSGGVVGLRLVVLALFVAAGALLWRLSAPCVSLVPRIALVFGSLYVVTGLWGERPYMVGVLALGVIWLVLDDELPAWTLVPLYWLWANSHGSFPLGVGLTVAYLVGRRMDRKPSPRERSVLVCTAAGTLAAVIGPLGLQAVLFPVKAFTRSDVLFNIVEWQPASFQSTGERLFLVLVVAAILTLVRRPSWALTLPAVAFTVLAVMAQRNIVMAVMVLVPVIARGAPSVGELTIRSRPQLIRPYVLVGILAFGAATVHAVSQPFGSLEAYPIRPLSYLEVTDAADARLASQDIVGNFLEGLDGVDADAFNDDRVDMLPVALVEDGLTLLRGEPGWESVLVDRDVELVVWERSRPLGSLLAEADEWQIVFSDTSWTLACRRGPTCEALTG